MIATGNHNFEKFAALCNTLSGEPRRLRRSGRQVGDPYKLKSFWLAVTNGIPTYSPFTLTYYLRPHKWALPGGLGSHRVGTEHEASLASGAAVKNTIISIKIYKKSKYYKKIQEKPWDFFL